MSPAFRRRPTFLPDPEQGESTFLGSLLRKEAIGGAIVLVAAALAVVWANSPLSPAYFELWHQVVGFDVAAVEVTLP